MKSNKNTCLIALIRTDVFYRSIEMIRLRNPGGQSADSSAADEHLRRAGCPSVLRNTTAFACFPPKLLA